MKSPELELHSQAFNVENLRNVYDRELRDDVISYLGEYRLQVQRYPYELTFSAGDNRWNLRDSYRGEPMKVKAIRTIERRRLFGEPIAREEAELTGIISLEDQLRFSQNGDTIIWASPPGPREEGYGDYGFLYVGNVLKNGQELHLSMTAIRVEKPTIAQFNGALTALTGISTDFDRAEDFLQTPRVVRREVNSNMIEEILGRYFFFEKNNTENVFQKVIGKLRPMVEQFIDLVKRNPFTEEKLQAFYTLENYAMELKRRYEGEHYATVSYFDDYRYLYLHDLVKRYGHEPKVVRGSCGSSGKTRSNGLFSRYEALMKAIFGEQEWFSCPKCNYQADGPVGNSCPGCGISKEDYAKESGKEICD